MNPLPNPSGQPVSTSATSDTTKPPRRSEKSKPGLRRRRAAPWLDGIAAAPVRTNRDDLCLAFHRRAATHLLTDRWLRLEEHVLVIVEAGAVILETSQQPVAIHAGDSALVRAGNVYLTEAPAIGVEIDYWILSFGPPLLRETIGEGRATENLARLAAPVYSGVYPQRGILPTLRCNGLPTPAGDVVATFKVLFATISATALMFLHEHFFWPRRALQEFARTTYANQAKGFPGGLDAFRKSFRLYHGIAVDAWLKRVAAASQNAG